MKGDGAIGWLALLWAIAQGRSSSSAGAAAATAANTAAAMTGRATMQASGWIWPMPRISVPGTAHGGNPVISDPMGSARDGGTRRHAGVDVMYERERYFPKKSPAIPAHESRGFFVPAETAVIAVQPGKVWSTTRSLLGWRVVVDHGPLGYATIYQHGDVLAVPLHKGGKRLSGVSGKYDALPTVLARGALIMSCGYSLADGEQLRHLHFEMTVGGRKIDPAPYLARASVI